MGTPAGGDNFCLKDIMSHLIGGSLNGEKKMLLQGAKSFLYEKVLLSEEICVTGSHTNRVIKIAFL